MLDWVGLGYTLLERADGCRLYEIFLFYFNGLISLSFYFLTFSCISFVDMQICPRREGVRFGKRGVGELYDRDKPRFTRVTIES